MSVAVYSITRNRLEYTKKSFKLLRSRAGIEFDHYVFDNGSTDGTPDWLTYQNGIHWLKCASENYGQNIAANVMLDEMVKDHEWIVRWDNDMVPRDRRFLDKLIKCARKFKDEGVEPVVAPYIKKLLHPIPTEVDVQGQDVGFNYHVVAILGGMCRVHHRDFFSEHDGTPWRYNPFAALGFGEAVETAKRVDNMKQTNRSAMLVRIPWVSVEHYKGTDGQAQEMPDYHSFRQKDVARYVGYGL